MREYMTSNQQPVILDSAQQGWRAVLGTRMEAQA
jgi:hypothetical protein